MFSFSGKIPASKSWLNRALILRSFEPGLNFQIDSQASDVRYLIKALKDLENGSTELDAGLGGTTFRFLALRVSRCTGTFFIKAEAKLLSRPQAELSNFLSQVGVKSEWLPNGLRIEGSGWKLNPKSVFVSGKDSSQFLSAVLLSAIGLNQSFTIVSDGTITSEPYLKMTLQLMQGVGISVVAANTSWTVPANSKPVAQKLEPELDMSSAFSLIACAVAGGEVNITNWKPDSLQPDLEFRNLFRYAGIRFSETQSEFKISQQRGFRGIKANLGSCPDLFPVLCALFSFAQGESHFYGAPQLKHKESNRILKTHELLKLVGIESISTEDGLILQPNLSENSQRFSASGNSLDPLGVAGLPIVFDPDHDHRMAMAASLLRLVGNPIQILHPEVINKSYPEFYQHIGYENRRKVLGREDDGGKGRIS